MRPIARLSAWYSRRAFGKVPEPLTVTAQHPGLLRGYIAYEWELGRANRVDEQLKILAETKAAALAGCEWCLDIASMIARKGGITREQLADLPNYRDSEHFSADERLVLDYATAMTRTPLGVDDDLLARVKERFDAAQLVELTAAIAWENYRARFNWALGMDPQGFAKGACAIPERNPPASRVSLQ
jgi:AhpD family alkylhydroperoxidase